MRILYFSRTYTTHDRRFLCRLAESSHEVWFLRLEDDGIAYETRSLPAKVQVADWPVMKRPVNSHCELLSLKPHFEDVLARIQPDIVHAGPVPSCGYLAAQTGFRPFVVMSWGSDLLIESDRTPQARWIAEYTLKNADLLLCDCHSVRAKAEQIAGYTAERILQIPWGIDLQEFTPRGWSVELSKRTGRETSFVLLSTRTWAPGYGIEVLLEAFRLAHYQNSALKLALLGDGSLEDEIERYVREHRLQHAVQRPGRIPQEQLPDYFRAANLYVSCTPSDGTSISLLEALGTGLPVVVTDTAGNSEWIRHGENGWLAQPGDAQAFAKLFLHVAALAPAERTEIGRKNRRLAEERANWNRNSEQLLCAYELLSNCVKPQVAAKKPSLT